MTEILCPACFFQQDSPIPQLFDQTGGSPLNTIICLNPDVHQPQISQLATPMTNPPVFNFYMDFAEPDSAELRLQQWVEGAEDGADRNDRLYAVEQMKEVGVDIENDALVVRGHLTLDLSEGLRNLPDHLTVMGDLDLEHCIHLRYLPENLLVEGSLLLSDCQDMYALPENMVIEGNLDISRCYNISQLPESLVVKGHLDLSYCPLITHLPEWIFNLGPVQNQLDEQARNINVSGSGLASYWLDELENNEYYGIRFMTGLDLDTDSDSEREGSDNDEPSVRVSTRPGHEACDLLEVLRQNPQERLFVQYIDQPGIDQGGLVRQAFDEACQQLCRKPDGLFSQDEESLYSIRPFICTDESVNEMLNAAFEFGLILGNMAKLRIGTGHEIAPAFYKKLFDAHLFLYTTFESNLDSHESDITYGLINPRDADSIVPLMGEIMPDLYGAEAQQDYLKSLPLDDLKDYTVEIAIYMVIASEMRRAGFNQMHSLAEMENKIAGPQNALPLLQNRLKFVGQLPSEPNTLIDTFESWVRKSLNEADKNQIQAAIKEITGARFLTEQQKTIRMGLMEFENDAIVFKTHTCTKSLEFNKSMFKNMVDQDDFELFKTTFLNGFSRDFNME